MVPQAFAPQPFAASHEFLVGSIPTFQSSGIYGPPKQIQLPQTNPIFEPSEKLRK
jgi:hypothetical protein